MKADLFWIPGPWRGRLAIATRPRGGDWLDDEASAWRQADVDVIVSLLENEEAGPLDLLGERQAAEDHALGFISFPIPDRGVPASLQEAASLIGTPHHQHGTAAYTQPSPSNRLVRAPRRRCDTAHRTLNHMLNKRSASPLSVRCTCWASDANSSTRSKSQASSARRALWRNCHALAASSISGSRSAPQREHIRAPRKRA